MKKLGKIIGVLVFTMLFCLSIDIVQAAAPPRLDEANLGTLDTEQATITVTNVHKDDAFFAFKILDVYKNKSTNEINYRYTDKFYAFLEAGGNNAKDYSYLAEEEYFKLTSGDITSGSTQTSSTLDVLVSDYAAYAIKNNTEFDGKMIVNGNTASLTTDTGAYLIISMSNFRIYAVMVGNLNYKEENGEWVKQNATIVAKVSEASIQLSVKERGTIVSSFSIGEEYDYFIEAVVPPTPTNSINKKYSLMISAGNGITLDDMNNMTISNGGVNLNVVVENDTFEGTEYDAKIIDDDENIIGVLSHLNKDKLSAVSILFIPEKMISSNISITFKAKLNEKALSCWDSTVMNSWPSNKYLEPDPNDLFAVLSLNTFPYGGGLSGWVTRTHVPAYKLQFNKHVLGDPTKKLGGAVFEIYRDASLTKKVGSVTTDEDGFAEFSGLGEGKYYLKEVTAPTGYSLLKRPTEIEIKYDESLIDSETGEYCGPVVDIANQKISALPITGGMGTILYTLVGILFIGSAGVGIIYYKNKNRNLV